MVGQRSKIVGVFCFFFVLGAVGCSEQAPPLGKTFTLTEQEKPLFTVTGEGGDFCSETGLCFHFPSQAVTESTTIRGRLIPAPQGAIGFAYQFETQNLTFAKDFKLELPVPEANQQMGLVVAFLERTQWKSVPTEVTQSTKTRTGTTRHLSQWALFPETNCQNGICQISSQSCSTGQTRCGATCTDLQTDKANCGACGTACQGTDVCQQGKCGPPATTCSGGKTLCSGVCVDLQTDTKNCGGCGTACQSTESCQQGKCAAIPCPNGLTRCSGTCVDVQTESSHCGGCGKACPAGQTCQAGACKAPSSQQFSCYTMLCGGNCVDHEYDENNCGGCGRKCGTGEICCKGACIAQDDKNCGGCGHSCLPHHSCQNGTCKLAPDACPTGLTYCVTPNSSGVCVDLKTAPEHCGKCGNKCSGNLACTNGVCSGVRYKSCRPGDPPCVGQCLVTPEGNPYCDTCNGQAIVCGGKCTTPFGKFSNDNCGGCGFHCPKGTVCGQERCEYNIIGGSSLTFCDGVFTEFGSNSTNAHCGGCYKRCPERISCQPKYSDVYSCDCQPHLLCEGRCWGRVDDDAGSGIPPINPNHCGACNQLCPQGMQCKLSAGHNVQFPCEKGPPNPGWTWCGKRWARLANDALNCGACKNVCPNGHYCSSGQCQRCPSNQLFCNGHCVAIDEKNCGTCGTTCPTGGSCTSTSGNYTCKCPTGQTNCSRVCVNLQTDAKHCGTCGTACNTGETCNAGVCSFTCAAGLTNCSGQCTELRTDSKHCGQCGNACSAGETCSLGLCSKGWIITQTSGRFGGEVNDIASDSAGNLYITGYFGGNVVLGSTTLTSVGQHDVFVAKISPKGSFVWAVQGGGTFDDEGVALSTDSSGNIYVLGTNASTATFGSTTLGGGRNKNFLLKLSSQGAFVWTIQIDYWTNFGALWIDSSNNLYIAGARDYNSSDNTYIQKLSSAGALLWSAQPGYFINYKGSGSLKVNQIQGDSSGNLYISGSFAGTLKFGKTTLKTPSAASYTFVAKLNSSGSFIWAVQFDAIWSDGLTVDASGNVTHVSTKSTPLRAEVRKYDTNGKLLWNAGQASRWGRALVLTTKGEYYLLTQTSSKAFHVSKIDSSGKFLWVHSVATDRLSKVYSITLDASDNYFVAGTVPSDVFKINSTQLLLQNKSTNLFVTKNLP